MKAIKYVSIIAASIFIFSSCTKEIAGPTGPQGNQGPQGASSSYNVVIDSITPTQWAANSNGFNYLIYPVAYLTTSNSNIVEVYSTLTLGQSAVYTELPFSPGFNSSDWLFFSYSNYELNLQYTGSSAPTQQIYIKIVIITQP